MDRNALLLYLQNVRDLEIVRNKIWREWKSYLANIDEKIKWTKTEAHHEMIPAFVDENADGRRFIVALCSVIPAFSFAVLLSEISSPSVNDGNQGLFMVILVAVIGIFSFLAWKLYSSDKKSVREDYEAKAEKIRQRNIQQDRIAEQGKKDVQRYQQERKRADSTYKQKYDRVTGVLAQFYSMNILANQYRNLASTVYIYDYMSSSQASLEDTLIHEHMEDGIQRLAARLDRMADRLEEVVYETRCIRDENRASVERTIGQNERMLRQLENVSYDTQEAARYAELASNYSRANAYFALADHLR